MKELRKRQPALARVLDDYVAKHGHEFAHYETQTPAGRWVEGLTEKPFFQPSEKEWKFNWSHKSKNTPVFFLYGTGVAPYLFKAIRALPQNALSLIVVEPNVSLLAYTFHLTHVYHAMPLGTRLNFIVIPETTETIANLQEEERALALQRLCKSLLEEALVAGITAFGIFTVTQAEVSLHPGEEEANKDAFVHTAKNITEWSILRLQALGNSAEDTMIGLRQMALMAPWILYGNSPKSLLEPFRGRPFVVVSAGPSLEKNFELLRDIQDKCIILATDAVLKKMIKAEILPHIVCVLERGIVTYDLLFAETIDEYPEACSKILLIAQAVCTPKIFGRWPGPKIIVGKREVPVDKWFISGILHRETLTSGSSVAHMNYALAAGLGASSIAVIGQDLALGGDGKTHASDIYDEDREAFLKEDARQSGGYRVPGALGGEVETTEVWLSFLRTLENFIVAFNIPTWDCTEGGALIAGTLVEPFADYIEKNVASLEPIEQSPAEIVNGASLVEDRTAMLASCEGRFEVAFEGLQVIAKTLDEMEETMKHVSAAGLEPARRVAYARSVGRMIDRITDTNEMFAFVTQSYVYLASMELALTRSLETVDEIERWMAIHQEIVDSHRGVLAFIRVWLQYGREVLRYYATRELPVVPLGASEAQTVLERLHGVDELSAGYEDETFNPRFEIDALLTRCDPVRLNWPGRELWALADSLMEEGRSQEAISYMDKAACEFDGKEMPVAEMVAFLKSYANMLATHDLCFSPLYHKAEIILANAMDLAGERDEESKVIMKKILEGEVATYESMASTLRGQHIGISKWFQTRSLGEQALIDGELDKALLLVWKAIDDHWRTVPDWAASHLDWLALTLEKCFDVQDVRIKAAVDTILAELAENGDMLRIIRIWFNERFVTKLREYGMDSTIELSVRRMEEREEPGKREDVEEGESSSREIYAVAESE